MARGCCNRFRSVTLPMLSPISFFLLVTSLLNSFQAFDIIQVMTEGGPVDATNTLIYYVYEQGFIAFNAGRAAAAAIVLFVIMLGITLIQLRYAEGRSTMASLVTGRALEPDSRYLLRLKLKRIGARLWPTAF